MKRIALGLAALVAVVGIAGAAGQFPGYPIVGGASYCGGFSTGPTGQVCTVTVPAGPPATTGIELMPADTELPNGQQPQTVTLPSALVGSLNVRINRLIGGDFTTNLWQRGTTPVSAASPSTTVIGADRWAVYSSGNVVTVTKQTGAADTLPANGYYASMRVSRPSGTNTSQICTGQVLDKNAAADLIAKNGVFSFYALAGAGLNAVSSNNITATIAYYTAADSATPLTNTDAFMKGTVTGYQAVTAGGSSGTTATIASGVATINISTTWTRYAVYGPIPAANAAGTAVTGAGVTICYTPASGTGGSTEWFEVIAAQLQAMPSTATAALPAGITATTGFERRPAALESVYQNFYSQVLTDGAATLRFGACQATTTAIAVCPLALEPMRITPVTTVSTATSFGVTVAAGTAATCTTLAAVAASNTTSTGTLSCTTGGTLVAGNAAQFIGAATAGTVTFSSEP